MSNVTIRNSGETAGGRQVDIADRGGAGIDTPEEATEALNAAGDAASRSVYIVGGAELSYAQLVGWMRLGRLISRTAGASQDNAILENASLYDNRPRPDGTAPVDATGTARTPNTALDAASLFTGANALPAGARITGVLVTRADGTVTHRGKDGNIPGSALAQPGDYVVRGFYRVNNGPEMYRDVKIRVGTPAPVEVNLPPKATGSAYGAVLHMPATAMRPADNIINGAPVRQPVPVGHVETTPDFPEGSKYQLFVDSNPVGEPLPLPADRRTNLAIPGDTKDGPHQIQLRVIREGKIIIYPTINVAVQPATQFNGEPVMEKPSYSRFSRDQAKVVIDVTENIKGVKIKVGGHEMTAAEFSGNLTKGSNKVVLKNPDIKMKSSVNWATPGTYDVVIILPGGETKKTQLVIANRGGGGPPPPPPPPGAPILR